ncbi:MAG: phosphoribosyltransferase [Crocinitomicaceae bacterium]|nr:phosphoribosyltransferase [Crocinitomicaceae bacterium]|tara:strand:- start:584 stop:1087 length:504 start_codon:yes stop_codon:yes gene_type:complete
MPEEKTLVLNHKQIQQKITRIAHQIYENNFQESELYLIGIENRGSILSERLFHLLKDITPLKVYHHTISLNKDEPLKDDMVCSISLEELDGKNIVLIDDVLNTGKALIYAAKHFLRACPKSMQTVALIDRRHRNFPIRADYVGLTLATTLQEHISVEFGEEDVAYLE